MVNWLQIMPPVGVMTGQNQFVAFTNFTQLSAIVPLLLGGWLALIAHSTPAQAKTKPSDVLMAQRVLERLPPPPNVQVVPFGQPQLPQLPSQPVREFDFQAPSQPNENEFSPNFQRYLVYVSSDSELMLERVRVVEPTAYIRSYQGRSIIQAGVFSQQSNAQRRVRELEDLGIGRAQIVSFSNGQGTPTSPVEEARSSSYYVAIPVSSTELPAIANRIRRLNRAKEVEVSERYQPRGPHVAVGPFVNREEAEGWNSYLQSVGYGDARVYYGR